MRGPDEQTQDMFSDLSPEARVRHDHPLRAIRRMTDDVFTRLSPRFARLYSDIGRPSIPPEQLLRALLLQSLYTIRSERLLMEEIDYSIVFRWFIGLSLDEPIWAPTTFTKNRDRLLQANDAPDGCRFRRHRPVHAVRYLIRRDIGQERSPWCPIESLSVATGRSTTVAAVVFSDRRQSNAASHPIIVVEEHDARCSKGGVRARRPVPRRVRQ